MYYKKTSNIIFRNYGSFGYLTDNRNFSYKPLIDNSPDIGDKIISSSGVIFWSALSTEPQSIDSIISTLCTQFSDADAKILRADLKDFFYELEQDGFLISGDTFEECYNRDFHFTYAQYKNNFVKPESEHLSTNIFFENYFCNTPQLTNVHIEITEQCNEKCVHCYIPNEKKNIAMSSQLFFNVLSQCREMNLLHLTISGGEPFLHKDFLNFLKKCNEYNFSVNVLTNLTLLDNTILEEMIQNPLLGVQTSLYSMNANIHDSITQVNGSHAKTMAAIFKLIEATIPLQISCPIMKQNINCFTDVETFGQKHNISVSSDYVLIGRYNQTTDNLDNRLSLQEVEHLTLEKLIIDPNYLESLKKEVLTRQAFSDGDSICSVCHSSVCISETGSVYPCAGWKNFSCGNLTDSTLRDIWHHSESINFLRNLRRMDFPNCLKCTVRNYCTMCMVRNANESLIGSPFDINEFFCNIAKTQAKLLSSIHLSTP